MKCPTPAPADLTDLRRARRVADWLARIRTRVPERREVVKYQSGIIWRQNLGLLNEVLATKVERELTE